MHWVFIKFRFLKKIEKISKLVHLWLGLTCGLLASVSGITGAMYVWQPEIVRAIDSELLVLNDGKLPTEKVILSTAKRIADQNKQLQKIFLPYREQQSISVVDKEGLTYYYHPETAKLLGGKTKAIIFFEDLLNIHRNLGIPNIGKYIVGTSSVIFFLFLLSSGLFLWWRANKKNLRKGLSIQWKSKNKKLNYDIHKSLGALFFIPLTIIAFTGGYFTYYQFYKNGFGILNTAVKSPTKIGETFNRDMAFTETSNSYYLRAIYFPSKGNDDYKYRYVNHREVTSGLRKTKEITTNRDNKIIGFSDYNSDALSEKITAQMYVFHIGEIAGFLGRILIFLSGFVPLILFITGLRFYLLRKKQK